MQTEIVKIIYFKMLKFIIKRDKYVNKMILNNRFSKKIQITKELNGVKAKGNVAVALHWNGN